MASRKLLALPDGPAGDGISIVTSQGMQQAFTVDASSVGGGTSSFAILRPGLPSVPPAYATLAEIAPLIAAADGAFTLYVDDRNAPAHIPAPAVLNGRGLLTVAPANGPVGGTPCRLNVDDGAQILDPNTFDGQIDIVSATTTIPALAYSGNGLATHLTNGARLILAAGASRPFLDVAAGPANTVAFVIDFSSQYRSNQVGVPFVNLTASGAGFSNFVTRLSPFTQLQNNSVAGVVGSTYLLVYDASVTLPFNGGFNGTTNTFEIDQGLVVKSTIDYTLDRLQSSGGTAIAALYPAYFELIPDACLMACDIEVVEQLAAPALATATAQIVDAGTLHNFTGLTDIATGGVGFIAPPPATLQVAADSPAHTPNLQLAITGDTFANLTAGHVRSTIVISANPRALP